MSLTLMAMATIPPLPGEGVILLYDPPPPEPYVPPP